MKKIVSYIILSAIMVTFLPYSALAETTNVGVKITGSASIDVVTTISADITVDLTTGTTTPTYMEIQNNSLVPVSAKITNITTTSEGAPSTFVKASDKVWNNLSKADTKKYVNFNIIGEGQDVEAKDILPNTEVDLGTLKASIYGCGAEAGISINQMNYSCNNGYAAYYNYYELNANLGSNWDEGEKNFTYQIETIYSKANSDTETKYNMPSSLSYADDVSISYVHGMISGSEYNDSTKTYIHFSFYTNTNNMASFENQINNKEFYFSVNNNSAHQLDGTVPSVDIESESAVYDVLFTIPALETTTESKVHYLTINVSPLNCSDSSCESETTFTFIKKVIAYSK